MYLMLTKQGPIFFADTTIIPEPTAEELVDITKLTAAAVRKGFNIEPRVALLSYSNFGSNDGHEPRTVRKAMEMLRSENLDFVVDGEIQANIAFNTAALKENYPFSDLVNGAPNVLIFPSLSSANIAYKLLQVMGSSEAIGPILLGMKKPVHILQLGSSVREVVNMINIATIDAQVSK
jgi:malate dehydrogenase (oxaloacetate-decarboxylating)(NADP+)